MRHGELNGRITAAVERQNIDAARKEAAEAEIGRLAEIVGRMELEMQHRAAQIASFMRQTQRGRAGSAGQHNGRAPCAGTLKTRTGHPLRPGRRIGGG